MDERRIVDGYWINEDEEDRNKTPTWRVNKVDEFGYR